MSQFALCLLLSYQAYVANALKLTDKSASLGADTHGIKTQFRGRPLSEVQEAEVQLQEGQNNYATAKKSLDQDVDRLKKYKVQMQRLESALQKKENMSATVDKLMAENEKVLKDVEKVGTPVVGNITDGMEKSKRARFELVDAGAQKAEAAFSPKDLMNPAAVAGAEAWAAKHAPAWAAGKVNEVIEAEKKAIKEAGRQAAGQGEKGTHTKNHHHHHSHDADNAEKDAKNAEQIRKKQKQDAAKKAERQAERANVDGTPVYDEAGADKAEDEWKEAKSKEQSIADRVAQRVAETDATMTPTERAAMDEKRAREAAEKAEEARKQAQIAHEAAAEAMENAADADWAEKQINIIHDAIEKAEAAAKKAVEAAGFPVAPQEAARQAQIAVEEVARAEKALNFAQDAIYRIQDVFTWEGAAAKAAALVAELAAVVDGLISTDTLDHLKELENKAEAAAKIADQAAEDAKEAAAHIIKVSAQEQLDAAVLLVPRLQQASADAGIAQRHATAKGENMALGTMSIIICQIVTAAIYYKFKTDSTQSPNDNSDHTVALLQKGDFRYGFFEFLQVPGLTAFSFFCCPVRWADTMRMAGFMAFWAGMFLVISLEAISPIYWWNFALDYGLGNNLEFLNTVISVCVMLVAVAVAVYYRQKLRAAFEIPSGTAFMLALVSDIAAYAFCPCLAVVQEARQLEEAYAVGHPIKVDTAGEKSEKI